MKYYKRNDTTGEKFERGAVQHLSSKMQQQQQKQQQIEWRRDKVMELLSKGETTSQKQQGYCKLIDQLFVGIYRISDNNPNKR